MEVGCDYGAVVYISSVSLSFLSFCSSHLINNTLSLKSHRIHPRTPTNSSFESTTMSGYFDLPRASSRYAPLHRACPTHSSDLLSSPSAYQFSQASSSRAVPLSAALLRQNPALESALRQFESSALKLHSGYVVPLSRSTQQPLAGPSKKSPLQSWREEDYFAWGDDEFDDDDEEDEDRDESEWGDEDGSEAGDEWETRDGILVLSSSPSLLPHPRPDFASLTSEDEEVDDLFPATPELESPLLSRADDTDATLVSSDSDSDSDSDASHATVAFPFDTLADPSSASPLELRRTSQVNHYEGFAFKPVEQKESEADELLQRALAFSGFNKVQRGAEVSDQISRLVAMAAA